MDLISLVLYLRPIPREDAEQFLPQWWGRAAHALLLKTIRAADENLANELHDESSPRPFTASNLVGPFPKGRFDYQKDYFLRYTGLNAAVSDILFHSIQPGGILAPGQVMELDYHPFQIQRAVIDPAQDEWAGTKNYNDLAAAHLTGSETAPRQVTLQLASPTQFHTHERTQPIPLPEMVFGSLMERWNCFAPITFPPELRRYAAECLVINGFDLSSRLVAMKNGGKRVGAVGTVGYTTVNYDRYWMSLVQTLAAFSFFAGVGAGVTVGCGQARVHHREK